MEDPRNGTEISHKKGQPASEDALLDEIRALGGDEDDLDLVMGVSSESENEYSDSPAPISKDMRHELAQFATQLGFSRPDVRDDAPSDVEDVVSNAEDSDSHNDPDPPPSKKGAEPAKIPVCPHPRPVAALAPFT